jgi:serine/threonine-protein kinase PknK
MLPAKTLIQSRYEVIRALGQGGTATTYLVHDRLWQTELALKLVDAPSAALREALHSEFSLLRGLHHPQLLRVHDFGLLDVEGRGEEPARLGAVAGGSAPCFYTSDYVPGATLGERARGASFAEIRQPLCDALLALRLMHGAGIRHGDVKPANILVTTDDRGMLLDLSCARLVTADAEQPISGTPGFIAPELLAHEPADHRADLYGVGATLARLGQLLRAPLPRELRALGKRLLKARPAERPASIDEVLETLGVEPGLGHPVLGRLGRFAGRVAELGAARSALERLLRSEPGARVLHVLGPDGIGRSRLLRELKWLAQQRYRVLETNPRSRAAVGSLLARAVGDVPLGSGLEQALAARDELGRSQRGPLVLMVDDADQLAESERQLLQALVRVLEPTDPVLLVVTSTAELPLLGPSLERLPLPPLARADIAQWVGEALSPLSLDQLWELSRGHPGAVFALLQQLASSTLGESELVHALELGPAEARARSLVASLTAGERRALGTLSIVAGAVAPDAAARFALDRADLDRLAARGLATLEAGGFKLVGSGAIARWSDALDARELQPLHRVAAELCAERLAALPPEDLGAAELAAQHVLHLALGGEIERAATLLLGAGGLQRAAPGAWARAASVVASESRDVEVQIVASVLEQLAGHARHAVARLEALLGRAAEPQLAARLRIELGECHYKLGDANAAIERLEQARGQTGDSALEARAAHLLARVLTRVGSYRQAVERAEHALPLCPDPLLRADLLEAAAIAHGYLGELPEARQQLDHAAGLLAGRDEPRRQIRAHGSRGLVAYQMGNLGAARADYGRAFELAERAALSDQLATAALNFGTVCHQSGQWAEALSCYERGMRMAVALGQISTEAVLRFNLAKLFADLGLFERSELMATRCEAAATEAGVPALWAAVRSVRAEVAWARRDEAQARHALAQARERFETQGSARERAEIELQLAEIDTATGQLEAAAARLERVGVDLTRTHAADVEVRLGLARARLDLARSRAAEAISFGEAAARDASALGQPDVAAEAERVLGDAWDMQGASALGHKHRQRARELWERLGAGLPAGVREAFWLHPKRAALSLSAAPAAEPAAPPVRERKLERLLEVNKRLNSSLDVQQVLRCAMDAAVELTGAERGFVLLERETARGHELRVAVARNLDREQVGQSQLKFSRGIAQQVIATGMPMITADAQADGRFSTESSVHAMHLKSVVCVPVQSPTGVLGALYLDNRFERGRFTEDDVTLLRAFADQVALALGNARLHDELKKRNRQLEAERQRVEELAAGQAAEIDRLHQQMRQRQPSARPHRFDYASIVGSGRAMQDVFDLLDRVIDTSLPILIQGESGTGKELVARIVHSSSPRGKAPLVSINCAALPETLLESELFGYERGAFTGADRARDGLVVQARGGTLFLDELGEMPRSMQVKLLRVLQESEVQPLGSARLVPVDFRLVCATNRRLRDEVEHGRFREDLYYRVSAVEVNLPPLRDRTEDIPELVSHILGRVGERLGRPTPELDRMALRRLMAFDWPGNVRQLEHVVTKAVALADAERIGARDIELPRPRTIDDDRLSRAAFERAELGRIAEALAEHRWNLAKAARALGLSRPTLYRRIKRHGLRRLDAPRPA